MKKANTTTTAIPTNAVLPRVMTRWFSPMGRIRLLLNGLVEFEVRANP
jgi:hypothetical protein